MLHRVSLVVASCFLALGLGVCFLMTISVASAPVSHVNALNLSLATGDDPFSVAWSSTQSYVATDVAWADYDGDGDLDLAIANKRGPSAVLFRNDNGTLTADPVWESSEYHAETESWIDVASLVWADVDNDGDLDLLTAVDYQTLKLYRNNNGTLTSNPVWQSGYSARFLSLAWGDVDGDGDPDLVAGVFEGGVRLHRNDGGTLTANAVWSTSGSGWPNPAWGDVDGDGDLDLAVGYSGSYNGVTGGYDGAPMVVYRNDGGTLTAAPVYTSSDNNPAVSIAWGDADGDGDLDLAVANNHGNVPYPSRIYRNDNGTLTSNAMWSVTESSPVTMVSWGDYDNDNDQDLLTIGGGRLHLYKNQSGVLTTTITWSSPYSENIFRAAWGDYNNDGALDIAVANYFNSARLYRNKSVTLHDDAGWISDDLGRTSSVAWGDVDGDGDLDLAVGNITSSVRLHRNDGGTLTPVAVWRSSESTKTWSVAWGDVDGDGDLDLAVGNSGQPDRIYRNDNGMLTTSAVWTAPLTDTTHSVIWADYDNDGDLDLAVGNAGIWTGFYSHYAGAVNRLYRNDGVTGGVPQLTLVWSSAEADSTVSMAWGDMDGDGDLDLAVGNYDQPNRVYRNDGGRLTTDAVWSSAENDRTSSVAWGDVDGDGDLDLASANQVQPQRLYRNDNGMLSVHAVWSSIESSGSQDAAWGDADNDGDLDLAIGGGSFVSLYSNNGGALSANEAWRSTEMSSPYMGVAWGDVDGDGDLDLAQSGGGTHPYEYWADLPEYVYFNERDRRRLPGALPLVTVSRPGANANSFSLPRILTGTIALPYTLIDPEGDQTRLVRAYYSPDGGGRWLPAVAATNTLTTNLSTARFFTRTYFSPTIVPILDQSVVSSTLIISPTDFIADLDVSFNLTHTRDSDVVVTLTSPQGHSAILVKQRGGTGNNFVDTILDDEAAQSISSGAAPFTGRYRPEQPLNRFDFSHLNGEWTLTIADTAAGESGQLLSWGVTATLNNGQAYTYTWDVYRSGFFGQSDNVIFRIEAVPAIRNVRSSIPGPYLFGSYASFTFPFRVRGTQMRVLSGTVPISNAMVYRLPAGQSSNAGPIADLSGKAFRTDGQGYLQGRGQLNPGDRLVALYPVTSTEAYTLYYTSAAPTLTGLSMYTVTQAGVQTLTISAANPLLLFNLDVSLEWDGRNDANFLQQFQSDLRRTSELLYDWTNGQAALGHINVYFDKEHWNDAHLRIYATNRLRPNAAQGGIVSDLVVDPITATAVITYGPGQVNIGAVWNRYGESNGNLGEDWPRALAHELGHFAFFLDDDYLGLDAAGRLIPIDTCTGTAMSDPYREDYSEFHFQDRWASDCANALANKQTGRWDWKTITTFYPWLKGVTTNTGPSGLPLNVTQISLLTPLTPTTVLAAPIFNLTQNGARVQPGTSARAFLYQADRALDLGSPTLDQVNARGARVSDRLCVYEPGAQRLGCETISAGDEELALTAQPAWQPDLRITPINSRTLNLTVKVTGLAPNLTLSARLYPIDTTAWPTITLAHLAGAIYSGTFVLPAPAPQGYVQVWVNEPEPRRESVADYGLGGGGAYLHGRGAYLHGRGAYLHGRGAPTQSPDGQVVIFADGLAFAEDAFFALQAVDRVSVTLPGHTQVGQAYRLLKSVNAPSLVGASINFYYAGRDVPPGEENFLQVYFWDGSAWQALVTSVNTDYNVAVATIPATAGGVGVYALMSSIPIPLYGPGWDQFSYPVQATRLITEALRSIDGAYTIVYWYDGSDASDHWKVYAPGVPGWVSDLHDLKFAESYWISLTHAITLNLSGGLASDQAVAVQSPPATYYGAVLGSGNFLPTMGMNVTAWIDGHACGQGVTQNVSGQIVYSLNVVADGPGGATGCGAPGRLVSFTVNGQPMSPRVPWNNDAVWNVSLRRGYDVYLPLLKKG